MKKQLQQSIGVLYIRWNINNRIAVAVAYFEKGKMIYMFVDRNKMKKICNNFLPQKVTYDFISEYPIAMKKLKISEDIWNNQAIQQGGILEIHKTSTIVKNLTKKEFDEFIKIYLE